MDQHLKIFDPFFIFSVLLAIAGMFLDNMIWLAAVLALAAGIMCFAITRHIEFSAFYRSGICAVYTLALFIVFVGVKNAHDSRELEKNEGLLIPAHHSRPKTGCQISEDEFAIYAGGGAAFSRSRPHVLLSIAGDDMLEVEPLDDGSIRLKTLRLFDGDGDIVARIADNKLWVNPQARRERPDFSSLIVYDKKDVEVLKLEFLDHNSIRLSGVFRMQNFPPVIITEDSIRVGTLTESGSCSKDSGTGLKLG